MSQLKSSELQHVDYRLLILDPKINTRQLILESETKELAGSIMRRGLIQPLAVWEDPSTKKLYVISGNRRFLAIEINRQEVTIWDTIPCMIHFYSTKEEAILANIDSDEFTSRVRRCDLAERYAGLAESASYADVAEKTGVPEYEIKYFVETWNHLDLLIRSAWKAAPSAAREIPMSKLYAWSRLPIREQLNAFEAYQSESGMPYLAAKSFSKNSKIKKRRRRSLKVINREIERLLASEGLSDIQWGAMQMARWTLGLTDALDLQRIDRHAAPAQSEKAPDEPAPRVRKSTPISRRR